MLNNNTASSRAERNSMTEKEAKVFIKNAMEQSRNALAKLLLIMPKVFEVRKKRISFLQFSRLL